MLEKHSNEGAMPAEFHRTTGLVLQEHATRGLQRGTHFTSRSNFFPLGPALESEKLLHLCHSGSALWSAFYWPKRVAWIMDASFKVYAWPGVWKVITLIEEGKNK